MSHFVINGSNIPPLSSFITHLTIYAHRSTLPSFPPSLLYLSINSQKDQLPPLPSNLRHLFVYGCNSLPSLPSSLLTLVWKANMTAQSLPLFPPSLQNIRLPMSHQSAPPQTMIEETLSNERKEKEGKEEEKKIRVGLSRRLMSLTCYRSWF